MPYLRRLPSGKWQATYRDARNRRHSITRPTKAQARAEALEAEGEIRRGSWVDPELARTTFRDWERLWWAARVVEENTRRKNRSVLDVHVIPEWGDCPLDGIRHIDVQAWVAGMVNAKVGAEAIRTAQQTFAAVIDAAVKEGLIRVNPARGVRLPTSPKQPERFLSRQEITTIVGSLTGQDARLVRVAADTGMRWGEIAGLHVHRVDFARGELHVVEVSTRHDGIKAYPKSKRSRRTLPLSSSLLEVLKEQCAGRDAKALVFTGRDGGQVAYTNWRRRVWVPAAAVVAEPHPTFHDTRHSYASWLISEGVDVRTVQALMGHESLMTTNRYAHVAPGSTDRVRLVLEGVDAPVTHDPESGAISEETE